MKKNLVNKLMLATIGFACLAVTGNPGTVQQQNVPSFAVYVSALEGECLAGQDSVYSLVNGRYVRLSHLTPEKSLVPLDYFAEDSSTRKQIENKFGKQKSLRVVTTPSEADFAFCVCTQYMGGLGRSPYLRLGVLATAVSIPHFLNSSAVPRKLSALGFWQKDNLLPANSRQVHAGTVNSREGRADINSEIRMDFIQNTSPTDLAEQFIQELPSLNARIAALPKTQPIPDRQSPYKIRPNLTTKSDAGQQRKSKSSNELIESDPDRVRIQTTMVTLPVSVLDRNGRAIQGLREQEFNLYEDNVKQELAGFGQVQQPFHVVLMIDTSCNVGTVMGEEFKEAVLSFFDRLPPKSQLMVISFSREILIETEFTKDRQALARALSRSRSVVGTTQRFHDALELVLAERLENVEGQKAIVVITNGDDVGSRLSKWSAPSKRLREADVIVYPVDPANLQLAQMAFSSKRLGAVAFERAHILEALAEETGGVYYNLPSSAHIAPVFASIVSEMQRFYWLSYYPTNDSRDNRYRRIKVGVTRPEAKVRARKGYQAAGLEKTP